MRQGVHQAPEQQPKKRVLAAALQQLESILDDMNSMETVNPCKSEKYSSQQPHEN